MSRELMQQALEALDSDSPDIQLRAAIALQIALKTEHEPVAWADMAVRGDDKGLSWTQGYFHKTPLYTAPPKHEWVGLTEDEAFACRGRDYFETYKAIEAQLKEKNT